jgi:hypothetical protein
MGHVKKAIMQPQPIMAPKKCSLDPKHKRVFSCALKYMFDSHLFVKNQCVMLSGAIIYMLFSL